MAEPSDLERFLTYVRVFEVAQAAGAGHLLEPCYSEDAEHVVRGAGSFGDEAHGREQVVAAVRKSVEDHDRRFDVRIPEILEGPLARSDAIRRHANDIPCQDLGGRVEWYAPKMAAEAVHRRLRFYGPGGYSRDLPYPQRLRDILWQIGDGSEEVMKLLIARSRFGGEILKPPVRHETTET